MTPPGQQQLRALFQPHRLVTRHRNRAGTSVASRQRGIGQRGQRAVAHLSRHADVGICCRHRIHRFQQIRSFSREPAADAVRLRTAEGVPTALNGSFDTGNIDIRLEFAVVSFQGAVVVDIRVEHRAFHIHTAGIIDIVRHRHAGERGYSSGCHLQLVLGIQRTTRHLQLTAGLHGKVRSSYHIRIFQLQFSVLINRNTIAGITRERDGIGQLLILCHQRTINAQGMTPP